MHYISRANGGLGIEENLADGCIQCHMKLDQSPQRKEMKEVFKKYLQSKYPNWNEETLRYKRYG